MTERCFLTMSQALQKYQGSCVSGPVGVGKTETVKVNILPVKPGQGMLVVLQPYITALEEMHLNQVHCFLLFLFFSLMCSLFQEDLPSEKYIWFTVHYASVVHVMPICSPYSEFNFVNMCTAKISINLNVVFLTVPNKSS